MRRYRSGINADSFISPSYPLISAVALILLLAAARFILDQPNLDGLDLAHRYLRDGARRARVAIAASVPRLDSAGSQTEPPEKASPYRILQNMPMAGF